MSTQLNVPTSLTDAGFVLSEPQILTSYGASSVGEQAISNGGTRMVKTYEFHLPMHHIREEPTSSPHDHSRYGIHQKNQQSAYLQKPAKRSKKLDARAKDDISSQMLDENITNHDYQQLAGSCDDVSKINLENNASQATIGKRKVKQVLCRRSQ